MKKDSRKTATVVLTIGHSTRSLEELVRLLKAHRVERVVDVRTIPRSRHNPQFNKETLPAALRSAKIKYRHLPKLGGLRHARADSPNMAWRNSSFRGFADYMQTAEFAAAVEQLAEMAGKERLALMCAEAVPWRCHRSLIADALYVRGFRVEHILSGIRSQLHEPTPWARIRGVQITYPLAGPAKAAKKPAATVRGAARTRHRLKPASTKKRAGKPARKLSRKLAGRAATGATPAKRRACARAVDRRDTASG